MKSGHSSSLRSLRNRGTDLVNTHEVVQVSSLYSCVTNAIGNVCMLQVTLTRKWRLRYG